MRDHLLTPEIFQAGARHMRERAPDPVSLEWLQEKCVRLERFLRMQYPRGAFPEAWERSISLAKPVTDTGAGLRLKSLLEHYYRVRSERLTAQAEHDGDAALAARALLRREPVVIQIAGEVVSVTGRSYSAMLEIAAHDLRAREMDEPIARVTDLGARVSAALDRTPVRGARGRRRTLSARLARLASVYERLATERERHRMAIYAHALTPHGGPATDVAAEAPAWWRQAVPEDDVELLGALFLAGPARVAAMPEPKKKDDDKPNEFGWASLFTFFEKRHMMAPARGWDTDLGQVIADVRIGNAPYDDVGED